MARYDLPDNVVQNIIVFLSRVKFDGANNFNEIDALQEIRMALSKPIVEQQKEDSV